MSDVAIDTLKDAERRLYLAFLEHGLTRWLALLPEQLARGLDRRRHGDCRQSGRWTRFLALRHAWAG